MSNSMNIEELSIKINADSTDASNGIDKLITSLNSLQSAAKSATSINTVVSSLGRLSKSVNGLNGTQFLSFTTGMNQLSASLRGLSGIDKSVGTTIRAVNNLSKNASDLNSVNMSSFTTQMSQLATALKPLAEVGKISLGSTLNQLQKLPTTVAMLEKTDMGKFASQMKQLAKAIEPVASKSTKLTSIFGRLPYNIKSASTQMSKYQSTLGKTSKSHTSLIQSLYKVENKFRTIQFAVSAVMGVISSVFEESSSYIENLNLFNVAMGECTDSAMVFAEKVQGAMGIDMSEWLKYQGSFNMLATGMGVASDQAQIMSQNLTQLSYDYSSLMNVSVETAFDKLNSAMSGQIKGLKEFGNNVSVAMVKETGLKYGLEGAVSSWDQNTQAMMRYITIMNNAANVDVFNDMARTLVTPANAVRILSSQFTQLKRAVGNVASVFISQLIPYIQIAVQLMTQLAQWFAELLGFKLPSIDYSGIAGGGTALDDTADSADNAADSIGGAADKAKELKKQLMGFDELNIINKPDDTSDSGSGGSGGGAGSGGSLGDIELPQYDFLAGLENSANEKLEAIKKKLAEMFKPFEQSWDTYGVAVMESFKYKWREIGSLLESIGSSFNSVWQNGTGKQSLDYIFTTVTNINVSVGNLAYKFKEAWDNAGTGTSIIQNLWDSFNNVLDCVADISEQIKVFTYNLDFKPLLKSVESLTDSFKGLTKVVGGYVSDAFKNVLLPLAKWTIEKAVPSLVDSLSKAMNGLNAALKTLKPFISVLESIATTIIKLVGNTILKGINLLASGLEALGKCKPLIVALTTALTALVAVTAVGKAVTAYGQLKNVLVNVSAMASLIKTCGIGEVMTAWGTSASGTTTLLGKLGTGFSALNSTTGILSGVSNGLLSLSVAAEGAAASGGILGTVMSGLSSGLVFLAANPLVAVVGGLAIAAGAIALFSDHSESASQKHKKLMESISNTTDKLEEETKALKDSNSAARENATTIDSSVVVAETYATKLSEIVDENGKITGSQQLAKEMVDKLNSSLGTNMTIQDGVIQNWKDEKQAIYDNIAAMKQKAIIEAYEESYVKAIQEQATARTQLTTAQNNYNAAKQAELDKLAEIETAMAEGKGTGKLQSEYQSLLETTSAYSDQVDQAKAKITEIDEATNNYNAAVQTLDGTVQSSTALIVEQYGILAEDGHYTYDSLATGLNDLSDICDENGEKWKALSTTEQEASKAARVQLLNDLATKGAESGKTYDQILAKAKDHGVKLTAADKASMQEQYNNYVNNANNKLSKQQQQYQSFLSLLTKHNVDINSKQGKQYAEELSKAQSEGTKQGQSYVDKLSKSLDSQASKVSDSTKKMAKTNKDNLEKDEAQIKVSTSSAVSAVAGLKTKIDNLPSSKSLKLSLSTNKQTLKIGDKGFDVKLMANGGIANMGSMFIAGEAGPEMVGRIGHKTGVANNDQIVKGISSGVFGAVLNAMSQTGGSNGNTRIVVQSILDGKKIGESVVDYNNGVVKQTGKSPLMV